MLKFAVLYTKQKTKKQKAWNDGKAHFNTTNGKLTLFDEKDQVLDSTHIKVPDSTKMVGERFETSGYLIDVDAPLDPTAFINNSKQDEPVTNVHTTIPRPIPTVHKRGFVPPRQFTPKSQPIMNQECEDDENTSYRMASKPAAKSTKITQKLTNTAPAKKGMCLNFINAHL
jgi:hypothetical protein